MNTIFDFCRTNKLPVIFKSPPANLLRLYISEDPAILFTSFLLSVLAPQVSI
jgi:hypothetical protein